MPKTKVGEIFFYCNQMFKKYYFRNTPNTNKTRYGQYYCMNFGGGHYIALQNYSIH